MHAYHSVVQMLCNVQLAEKDARNNEGNFDGMDCVGYGTLHVIYIAA